MMTETGREDRTSPNNNIILEDPTSRMGRSFPIGSLFGVPIQVHSSYFLLLFIVIINSLRFNSFKSSLFEFLLYGPILFVTILIHEFGHVLTARRLGGTAIGVVMWPLGGFGISSRLDPPSNKSNALVAFAGPATHIVQMIFWVCFGYLCGLANDTSYALKVSYEYIYYGNTVDFLVMLGFSAFYLNLTLFLFNLFLPVYPLDGGQIFVSCLLMRGYTPEKAGKITAFVSIGLSSLLLLEGIISFFTGYNPFSILNILVSLWIFFNGYGLYKLIKEGHVRQHPLFASVDRNHEPTSVPTSETV